MRAHPLKGMEPELLSPEELMDPSLALRRSPGRSGGNTSAPTNGPSLSHRPPPSAQSTGWFTQLWRQQNERANGGYSASELHQPPYVSAFGASFSRLLRGMCTPTAAVMFGIARAKHNYVVIFQGR